MRAAPIAISEYPEKSQSAGSVYSATMKRSVERMEKDEQNGMAAEGVAAQMVKQVMSNRMKSRVVPGFQYQAICSLFKILPTNLVLWIVGKLYA